MKSLYRLSLLLVLLAGTRHLAAEELSRTGDTVDIDMPDERRLVILRKVSDEFELNLVVPNSFPDEKISIKLRDAQWRQIFDACLIGTGYIYVPRGNIIWLVQAGSLLGEFGRIRDQLDHEIDENGALREFVRLVTRPDGEKLTEAQHTQVRTFLANPASSAYELPLKLKPAHADDILSIDFPNQDLSEILRNVADLFELKLVMPPDFPKQKVSVKLRDVTWQKIFETCLIGSDYIYLAHGNVIRLVPADRRRGEFRQMRDLIGRETDENRALREVVALLTGLDGPALTVAQRAQIQAFLKDPASSAAGLVEQLGLEPVRAPAGVTK